MTTEAAIKRINSLTKKCLQIPEPRRLREDRVEAAERALRNNSKEICAVVQEAWQDATLDAESKQQLAQSGARALDQIFNKMYSEDWTDNVQQCDGRPCVESSLMPLMGPGVFFSFLGMVMHLGADATFVQDSTLTHHMLNMTGGKASDFPAPGPMSTPISRFDPKYQRDLGGAIPPFSSRIQQELNIRTAGLAAEQLKLTALYEARLSLRYTDTGSWPVVVACDDFVATCGGVGWKNRRDSLWIYDMKGRTYAQPEFDALYDKCEASTGLDEAGFLMGADPQRSLVWHGAETRIKAFHADATNKKSYGECAYTLRYETRHGRSLVVAGDRLLAGSDTGFFAWDIPQLDPHPGDMSPDDVENMKELDHAEYLDPENLSSDQPEEVDLWRGVRPHHTVAVAGLEAGPGCRLLEYLPASSTLVGVEGDVSHMRLINAETGATTNYLMGHTGPITDVAAVAQLPEMLLSGSEDTCAKVWDSRSPLAVATLKGHGKQVHAVELVYIGGVPMAFTGGQDEVIKVWDLRAQLPLYELSAGNNVVLSMAWHAPSCTLLAASECPFMDRMGCHHDCKPIAWFNSHDQFARARGDRARAGSSDDEDGTEEEEEEDGEGEKWPEKALHGPDYFAHRFNVCSHALIAYTFMHDTTGCELPMNGSIMSSYF